MGKRLYDSSILPTCGEGYLQAADGAGGAGVVTDSLCSVDTCIRRQIGVAYGSPVPLPAWASL